MVIVGCKRDSPAGGTGSAGPTAKAAKSANPAPGKPQGPPPTAICKAARAQLGADAACVETPLPELTTAAGTITRVHDANDPIKTFVYALTKPSGQIVIGRGSGDNSTSGGSVDEILKAQDIKAMPPAQLANLYAELFLKGAVARCVDAVVMDAVLEELAIPNEHGSVADPAIRKEQFELSAGGGYSGGGYSGGGKRLVDLRERG